MPTSTAYISRIASRIVAGAALLPLAATHAQDAEELAKQLSNPVAALISVPLQLNYEDGFGADGAGERWTLNVQPVVPISLSDEWNLISRTILPLIDQSDVVPGTNQSGIGDALQSFFLSPKLPSAGGWTWGAGPALLLPTGSREFSADQWALGPTGVALKQTASGWTYGALANHLWGVSNDSALPDLDATFLQPFVSKAFQGGVTASVNLESTYDWQTSQWTIPLNASYSKVTRFGSQLASLAAGVRVYLEGPQGGPEWGLRFTFTLLFPQS